MTNNSIFLIIFMIATAYAYLPPSCFDSLLHSTDCEWYRLCLEEKFKCGDNGYPLNIGYKYCTKANNWEIAEEAQGWNKKKIVCLK
jgi:hypothetical protein